MQWNISEIEKNEEEFLLCCDSIQKKMQLFNISYNDVEFYTLNCLLSCLDTYEQIENEVLKLRLYFCLAYYGGINCDNIEESISKTIDLFDESALYFLLSVKKHPEIEDYLDKPEIHKYKSFLVALRKEGKYYLDTNAEKIMRLKNKTGYLALQQLYLSSMEKAEFRILDKRVTYNQLLGLINHPDEAIRKKAGKKLGEFFRNQNNSFTNILNFITQDLYLDKDIRGFDSIYDGIYFENELSESNYETLEKKTIENVFLLRNYYKKKKALINGNKKWGVTNLHDFSSRINISDAKEIIIAAYNSLSEKYGDIVKYMFEAEHIDYECRESKQSGAICFAAIPEIKPYIFINYSGTVCDLFTLGHELGHAVHFIISAEKNSTINYMYSNLHSESIAVIFETLVCKEYLRREKYSQESVLEVLDNLVGKLFRQSMNYLFEKRVRLYKGFISENKIEQEWGAIRDTFYGDTVRFYSYEKNNYWSIPHFICEPLLTSLYAFSQVIAIKVIKTLSIEKSNNKIREYFSLGSNESFMEFLQKEFQIDLDKDWDEAFNIIEVLLDCLEENKSWIDLKLF